MELQKGYVYTMKRDARPNDDRNILSFCKFAKDAMYWPNRAEAEVDCRDLNRGVALPPDGPYICDNFQVEEEAPNKFLIYCEAPFKLLSGLPL
jgi:hypothetical protein